MNIERLKPFLELTKSSADVAISKTASGIIGRLAVPTAETNQQAATNDPNSETDTVSTDTDKVNLEGRIVEQGFNDLKDDAPAHKVASAYIRDIEFKDLPKDIQKDVERFAKCNPTTRLIHYGMVVSELLNCVDPHNYDLAKKHLGDVKGDKGELKKRAETKYILMMNGRIVDGHHFLCRCELGGLTSSLNVLDLSPVRFQKTSSESLWDVLKEQFAER